jgi:hypothetical protein
VTILRPYTILRLTHDLKNTTRDRRARYGAAAVDVFEAGTLLRSYRDDSSRYERTYVTMLRPSGATLHAPYEMVDAVVAAAAPAEPATAAEALFAEDVETHCADDILQTLLDTGAVTVDQIRAAARQWLRDINEEE